MLELFQFTGEDPLSFGKYVNIIAILRKIGKIPI